MTNLWIAKASRSGDVKKGRGGREDRMSQHALQPLLSNGNLDMLSEPSYYV